MNHHQRTTQKVKFLHLTATVRECWVLKSNKRLSGTKPDWTTEPTIHALAVESIEVEEAYRRQGECRAFLNHLLDTGKYDMVIVEAVGNQHLAEALLRWGWDCAPGVMDFYRRTEWGDPADMRVVKWNLEQSRHLRERLASVEKEPTP